MEFLFPDQIIPELPRFVKPTTREAQDFIRQTGGVWTNDILKWLERPTRPDRDLVQYKGLLTIAQQWYVLCDLMDDSKLEEASI